MLLNNRIRWYFPDTPDEAAKLIKQQGIILHAGGTRILKTQTKSIKGLVDIGGLKLNYIKQRKKEYHIGAAVTFGDIVRYSREKSVLLMLGKALSEAASTPLRNRITIGGSLKDFPLWSNLYAPLISLDAKVSIFGMRPGIYDIEDYVTSGLIKSKHIIQEIIVPEDKDLIWGVRRFTLLKFEYPMFNIAVSFKKNEGTVEGAKIVITGVKSRFKRFEKAEHLLNGRRLSTGLIEEALIHIQPKFTSDYKYSAEYKGTVAKVTFSDLLNELTGRER